MNALIFINLIDQNKNLSITNLLVIGFSIKFLFFMPVINLGDIVTLIGTFAVYAHKKVLISKKQTADDSVSTQLEEIRNTLDAVSNDVAKVKLANGAQRLR